MVGLASGLVWYYMKKVGLLLEKQSFRRFSKKRRVKKRVNWRYLSCLKPDLAHFLGAGSSDKNPGLLFYEKSRFLIEKTAFLSFSQSCWDTGNL